MNGFQNAQKTNIYAKLRTAYILCCYWGEQYRSLYQGFRYIEVRYISRFHCILLSFSLTADELLRNELDYLLTKQLRRRSKRSRYSYVSNRPRRSRSEFNARRYYKELARAQRLQNRRARQKMLHRTPITGKFRQSFSAVHICPSKRSRKSFLLKLCPNFSYRLSSGEFLCFKYSAFTHAHDTTPRNSS